MQLDEVLITRGLISRDQLALVRAERNGHRLDRAVIEMGLATEEDTLKVLGAELGMNYVELKEHKVDRELLQQFPTSVVFRHSLLPLNRLNGSVIVATS